MKICICEMGHYFDPKAHSECPYCGGKAASDTTPGFPQSRQSAKDTRPVCIYAGPPPGWTPPACIDAGTPPAMEPRTTAPVCIDAGTPPAADDTPPACIYAGPPPAMVESNTDAKTARNAPKKTLFDRLKRWFR